jgi:ABC-type lipoprotein export system ATPase subunit
MPVIQKPRLHTQPADNWPAVSTLSVENLFGRYTYNELNFRRKDNDDVAILYGDNGVGKTTLLKLIYSSLSPVTNEGNRGYLARTPFSRLAIRLMNGSQVEITKDRNGLIGSYTIRINDYSLHITPARDFRVSEEDNPRIDEISEELRKNSLDILYLSDDRSIKSTYDFLTPTKLASESVQYGWDIAAGNYVMHNTIVQPPYGRRFQDVERDKTINLSHVITIVSEWLARKTRHRTSSGDENASNVYLNVVKALSTLGGTRKTKITEREALLKPLNNLESSVKKYQKFGLIASYPLSEFVKILHDAPETRIPDIAEVLSPYLDSVITRLNALEEVRVIMSTFEEELNSYLRDKSATLHVDHELRFFDERNTNIPPSDLSSGERQLLFLFCAALMSRDGNSLIIIDEPELSLNVKWQRRLVSSLAKLAQGAGTQFIMATHSIEILSQHRHSVIELN